MHNEEVIKSWFTSAVLDICICTYVNINIHDQVKWDEFQVMWDEFHLHALKVALGKAWNVWDEGAIQEDWEGSHQYI